MVQVAIVQRFVIWSVYTFVQVRYTIISGVVLGSNKLMLRNQLSELVKQTHIGGILLTVEQYHIEEFYLKYLNDFVRIVHSCVQNNNEHRTRQYEVS